VIFTVVQATSQCLALPTTKTTSADLHLKSKTSVTDSVVKSFC